VTQLVICSFRHKEVLDASNLTKVIPVIKNKAGNESDSNNYRAISITSIWSKIFDKLVLMNLEKIISVKDNQFGFKKKLSTKMAVKVLEMSVKRNTDKKGRVCAAFIDVEKAFDSVDRNELWRILAERGVNKGVIDMIKIQYKKEVNKVLWDGKYSEVYKVRRGVRQGSALSAFLFSVVLDSALSDIAKIDPGFSHIGLLTNIIMYADDIVCFSLTRNELQNMLNVVAKALIKVGLKINLKKTVCMDFKAKGGVDYGNKKISIGKDTIEWVKSVKYLGIMLTHDMDWNMQMKEINRTISKQGNGIVMQFKRTLGQEDLYKVLEACAFHMYGVEFCGNVKRSLWHEVAKAYHWIIKKGLGRGLRTSNTDACFEVDLLLFQFAVELKKVNLFLELLKSNNLIVRNVCGGWESDLGREVQNIGMEFGKKVSDKKDKSYLKNEMKCRMQAMIILREADDSNEDVSD
jgi:hypothetical protein